MRKFNLYKEIIVVKKSDLQKALESNKSFGIDIEGNICHEPFLEKDILIYKSNNEKKLPINEAFSKNYQVLEDGERVLIKAFGAWQDIINMNVLRATYDDTTADGVDEFSTKELESIGWHAAEFNINYRTLVNVLENMCDGTLICIEQEEPYQFSGLGFIDDFSHAADVLFLFCQTEIKKLMDEDDDYKVQNLIKDEIEAAKFFKIIQ